MEDLTGTRHSLGLPNLQLGEVIGGGGFAMIYRAYDSLLKRDLAIKILRPVSGGAMREAFENEAGAHGPLSRHPNIVTIHQAGLTVGEERPYLVMDLIAGGSLSDYLAENGPVPWHHAVSWMIPISAAVQHAHDCGILHRDIKPANILLDPPSTPLLADLGIACLEEDTSPLEAMSFPHVAPEALRGERRGASADVFSLGTTLYQLLTDQLPFGSSFPDRHQRLDQPAPALPPEIHAPPWLDEALCKAMDPDVARRVPTAGQLERLLKAGMGATSLRTPTVVARPPTVRPNLDNRPPHPSAVRPFPVGLSQPPSSLPDLSAAPSSTSAGATKPQWTLQSPIGPGTMQPSPAGGLLAPAGFAGPNPAQQQARRGRLWLWVLVAGLALAAVAGIVAWQVAPRDGGDAEATTGSTDTTLQTETTQQTDTTEPPALSGVAVPGVVGLSEAEAVSRLQADGFSPLVEPVDRGVGSADIGQVVSQNPTPGEERDSGTVVTIQIGRSTGVAVPAVTGLSRGAAETALTTDGFVPRVVFVDRPPGSSEIGLVVSQDPVGGLDAESGSEVVLQVGQTTGVAVPGTVGLSESDARIRLNAAGFEPIVELLDRRPGSPDVGVAVDQEPDEGVEALAGSDVAIKVGRSTGLAGTVWLVVGYRVDGVENNGAGGIQTIAFDAAGQAKGFGGCNSYAADYSENGNALTIGQITSTLIACLGAAGEGESVFFIALGEVTSIRATGADRLELVMSDGNAILLVDDKDI